MGSVFEELPAKKPLSKGPGNPSERYDAVYFPKSKTWNPHPPTKVIIVGGGIGGIAAAVLISKKAPNTSVSLYDRQEKVGGTWALNVYPGVRCDVPSHTYQFSFDPNTDWSEYYPNGAEIQQYYEGVLQRHGLSGSVHVQHEVLRATWLHEANQWAVEIKNLKDGSIFVETAGFFVSAQGRISIPKHPKLAGLYDQFRGKVIHTAQWSKHLDLENQRIAVIGCGASGQQLIPNIIQQVAQLDHYVRNKTWVTATFAGDLHEATADAPGGPKFSEAERQRFKSEPAAYLEHRRKLDIRFHTVPGSDILGSEANRKLRERIMDTMRRRLGGDEEWLQRILPNYAPGCKRLTPAPGYLEALQSPKLDYVTSSIVQVDETGIITADGKHREVDIIITATGFERGFTTLFPVIGNDGVDLRDKWDLSGAIGYPESYLGIMAPSCPNYFTVLQAQGNSRGGSVPLQCELAATYIAKCIRKIQTQSYVSLEPRKDAAEEFNDLCNGYFQDKVIRDGCDSWGKQGKGASRVLISWPGTFHHRAMALREPRWEDFIFKRSLDARFNRFDYLGNGTTSREVESRDEKDLTSYLREVGEIDVESLHELWNQ